MGREVSGVAQVLEREVPGLLLPELRWGVRECDAEHCCCSPSSSSSPQSLR